MGLPTFAKGVHPDDHKFYTSKKSIEYLPLPENVIIPVQQHIGAPCDVLVNKGDEVKTGQVIARSEKYVSAPVHASITGKVRTIAPFFHPNGGKMNMIQIQKSGEDDWNLMPAIQDWKKTSGDILIERIKEAGIVGMGGAAFPTHVKLMPPKEKTIDSFILNGCECEPYLTADHRAMVEMGEKILTGAQIITQVLGTKHSYIGIEDNKPDAIENLQKIVTDRNLDIKVVPLEVKYPQGAEKMLIESVLKRKVPAGGLPMDVGVVVNNIGTAIAVAEAVLEGKPLIQRIVTVTGDGLNEPKNVMARIGTPFQNLIDFCGGLNEQTAQVFMGGPMMGISQWDLNIPVIKATSGIICSKNESIKKIEQYPCIRCGNCVSACPMNLLPTNLAKYSEKKILNAADQYGINNCIECGSCAFVCPSNIPLVQWIRIGKLRVNDWKRKQVA